MALKNPVYPLKMTICANPTATYQAINPDGFEQAPVALRIYNSGEPIYISFDGSTHHDILQYDETFELLAQYNAQSGNWVSKLFKGSVIYVRTVANIPKAPNVVYLMGWYQEG